MGIKDLLKVVRENCPEQLVELNMDDVAGYTVAVDISIYLYKNIRSCGIQRWLEAFIHFVCDLKRHRVHPIYIFDGPNPPVEKRNVQKKRRADLARQLERLREAERLYEILMCDYVPSRREPPRELQQNCRNLLKNTKQPVQYADAASITNALRVKIEAWTNQTIRITPAFGEKAKDVLTLLGLPYLQADGEAETLCAYLAIHGHVDAVLSEDTDVLAYGTPLVFSNIDRSPSRPGATIRIVKHADLCQALGLAPPEFKDLCILLSCDYNTRVKRRGKKKPIPIGQKRAYEMIQEYRSLDVIENFLVDPAPLNFRRCRELFTVPESKGTVSFEYAAPIAEAEFFSFLRENHCRVSHEYIRNLWVAAPRSIRPAAPQEKAALGRMLKPFSAPSASVGPEPDFDDVPPPQVRMLAQGGQGRAHHPLWGRARES